jgi:hypothetical protein
VLGGRGAQALPSHWGTAQHVYSFRDLRLLTCDSSSGTFIEQLKLLC